MQNEGLKVTSIIGARPQFIKAAAICRAVAGYNGSAGRDLVDHHLIHTGQHYDGNMSKVFFDELDIPRPDYNLGVGSGSHGAQTGKMLERIESILFESQPDWVLVFGDTNTTLAGALASAKLHIPVAHIEGGLRSYNRLMPEEINRVLTDHISSRIFCPTERAVKNLQLEGIEKGVEIVGDVMYDCALYYADKVNAMQDEVLDRYNLRRGSYFLATVHRAENTDDLSKMEAIFSAFNTIASPDCPIFMPIHPRTARKFKSISSNASNNLNLTDPVSYMEMVVLEKNARLILTDSGGVQKEAYFHGIPCVTLREETEWFETVEVGRNVLTGADTSKIISAAEKMRKQPYQAVNNGVYGNGESSLAIVKSLVMTLS